MKVPWSVDSPSILCCSTPDKNFCGTVYDNFQITKILFTVKLSMKFGGIWRGCAADLDALEWLDQVSGNMFPISWLTCMPRSDEHSKSHVLPHSMHRRTILRISFSFWWPASSIRFHYLPQSILDQTGSQWEKLEHSEGLNVTHYFIASLRTKFYFAW